MVLRFENVNILINLPAELLARIDESAKLEWMSRAGYIRFVLSKELKDKTVEQLRELQSEKMNGDKELEDFLRDYEDRNLSKN